MSQSNAPQTPGVPATMNTVWPPSNPSGTVIPFPLPWGGTGCCPPGGMDALMKCYCDIQQASAFIGQIMLDQINNNPAIIAAIIAGIEKSGSNLPLVGVTNGSLAQPGQVGEFVLFSQSVTFTAAVQVQTLTMGVLQPGDWDCWQYAYFNQVFSSASMILSPVPVGFSFDLFANTGSVDPTNFEAMSLVSTTAQASISVPSLIAIQFVTNALGTGPGAGSASVNFAARRRR